ncbi:MAG: hypothetical protein RIR16_788 [Actinomycetota bacterium]|jgi:phage shock protein A
MSWFWVFTGIAIAGAAFHGFLIKGLLNRIAAIEDQLEIAATKITALEAIEVRVEKPIPATELDVNALWRARLTLLRRKALRKQERKRRLIESISKISIDESRFK